MDFVAGVELDTSPTALVEVVTEWLAGGDTIAWAHVEVVCTCAKRGKEKERSGAHMSICCCCCLGGGQKEKVSVHVSTICGSKE